MSDTFFEDVTGVNEHEFVKSPRLLYKPSKFVHMICGYRAVVVDREKRQMPTFSVIKGDVRALQADPANAGALFQVASNFHGLEQTSPQSSPEDIPLNSYRYDHTQGPMAVMGTAADLVYRRYMLPAGPFTNAALKAGLWPLDMLKNVRARYGVQITVGGWADVVNALPLDDLTEKLTAASITNSVLVPDALVTHDEKGTVIAARDQRIHHVLTSAYDASAGSNNGWMDAFLIAAYVNTLQAVRATDAKKVFLTLVGGGVFHNPVTSVCMAMIVALNTIELSPDVSITVVVRGAEAARELSVVERFVGGSLNIAQCAKELIVR